MTRCCSPFAGALCRRLFRLAWLAAAVALAACGGTGKWVKTGVTEEAAANDISECEFYAQAVSLAETAQSNETYIGVSPTGDVTATQLPGTESLRYLRQGDAFARCMTTRGYKRQAAAD